MAVASTRPMIEAEGLHKSFGKTHALRGLDLSAAEGSILGVLGPNGAGKTTAVRILTTLTRADAGHATVAGVDTGRENLEMVGRLARMSGRDARARAGELLERFELADAAGRVTKTYSGGMRRRLDLAAALMSQPPVLFLDEPTTGLDPRGRLAMWDLIAELAKGGTTLLMTTQYLEEADRLADDIAVIDHGRVIARGTATELKRRVGGERLEVTVREDHELPQAANVLGSLGEGAVHVEEEERCVSVPVAAHDGVLTRAIRELDAAGIEIEDVLFRRPTLDEVFLSITGRSIEDADEAATSVQEERRR